MEGKSQSSQVQDATIKQAKRSRRGCQNCRRKKKKCDENKPTCFACARNSVHCVWNAPLKFRPQRANVTYTPPRGEERAAVGLQGSTGLSFENGPREVDQPQVAHCDSEPAEPISPNDHRDSSPESIESSRNKRQRVVNPLPQTLDIYELHHDYNEDLLPTPDVPVTGLYPGLDGSTLNRSNTLPLSPNSRHGPQSAAHFFRVGLFNEGVETLGTLGNSILLNDQTTAIAPEMAECQPSPDTMTDDGIFLPGSRYQELHNTLRDHVFSTARSTKPSRNASPTRQLTEATDEPSARAISDSHPSVIIPQSIGIPISSPIVGLTPHIEYILWKNWVEEISAWLDKFDARKHFRHTIPTMAKTFPHLRYSMLALSARQLERKDKSIPASLTLAVYQEAIHLLVPQLPNKDISIVASCVILCVLEMLSCSPKAWRRHLDGCASLIRSMNIHGNSSGLEKSLFWCFARMDVCGGLISFEKTLIPIDEWVSTPTLEADCAEFRNSDVFEDHANYSCYLLARALDFLTDSDRFSLDSPQFYRTGQQFYAQTWTQLFDLLEDWSETRPPEMRALLTQGASSSGSDNPSPFPTILFSNGAAISGNQQYHAACLLMLQRVPRKVPKKLRSILWHARQICGISISNAHHGCWTNSIQALWLAGQAMSHPSEHEAIVAIYERIERETGWGATWRADDLKQHWGQLDD